MYDASPLFDCTFPRQFALGASLAGALLWHFAAMWLLVTNGIVYVTLGIATGRFRRKLLPLRPAEVIADIKAALTFKLAHDDLSLQRRAKSALFRCDSRRHRDCAVGSIDLKPVQFRNSQRCSWI